MNDFTTIIYRVDTPVAWVTFNRPSAMNAMNRVFWEELEAALLLARDDESVRVVVFTGQGKAFSAGADLKESEQRTRAEYQSYIQQLQDITLEIIDFEKPTIAAINGYAIGSGYELALACDLRLMAESAQLRSPEAKISTAVTGGASRLLQQLIGTERARMMLFTADFVSAEEALRYGLVSRVVADDDLIREAEVLAKKIAQNSALSLRLIKRSLNLANDNVSMQDVMKFETDACIEAVSSDERKQALAEFQKK